MAEDRKIGADPDVGAWLAAYGDPYTDGLEADMPRYLIERSFDEGNAEPPAPLALARLRSIADANVRAEVIWLHSYVSTDRRRMFCVYEGPSPEAIRRAATLGHLPVDEITEIRVLDPFSYEA